MKKLLALILGLSLCFAGSAFAMHGGKSGMMGHGGQCPCQMKDDGLDAKMMKKMHMAIDNSEELGLTDEQVEKIKVLKVKVKKDMIQANAKVEMLKVDIYSELWKDDIDLTTVNKYIDEKYDIKKGKSKALVADLAAFKKIFTADQMTKLKELCKQKGKR